MGLEMSAQILVVESDPSARELIGLNLGRAGHVLSYAGDAEHALVMLDEHLAELVLVEWNLPGQCGVDLIRRLRAQARTRDLPIIMVSERSSEHDKVLALE